MSLTAYLPQDRLQALSRGQTLPDRTSGSAMLADISGFTPLTEGLRNTLGPRQGAEELTRHLNHVFSALIAEVERFRGSVISFAGDAITCWFDQSDRDSAARAAAAAFAMQTAMDAFNEISLPDGTSTDLSLKVAIASGSARRFIVGNPDIHYLDALAGETLDRASAGEQIANQGEILIDPATQEMLGEKLTLKEWRTDPDTGAQFAVVSDFMDTFHHLDASGGTPVLPEEALHSWIPEALRQRDQTVFKTEFRPCAVVFIRFGGIDYETPDCQSDLDAFITQLQSITARYEGALLQLTIGDKGSYAYLNFGAFTAHEDDARRAVRAGLEIQSESELPLQIGIAQGVMRVGDYGGENRRTFGALGDDVNLAARLMTTAAVGEILVTGHVHKAARTDFSYKPHVPLPMKGKAEPLAVFAVTGKRRRRAIRLQEPNYALPMVGRQSELNQISDLLDQAAMGKSQIVAIVAEAGIGKSRLAAEVIRSARRKGYVGYGGACQSDSLHTPYQTWKSIWQAFFDIDPEMPERKQMRWLEGEIQDLAPSRVDAMPLLNAVLDLNIPENEFTQNLAPKIRQSALHALLEDCLRAAAQDEPLLIVVEDLHWIDALSHDLLDDLAKALVEAPVCFLLAYRPPELQRLQEPRLESQAQFTHVELKELTTAEAESAIRAKLAQLYPARGGALPTGLVKTLMGRAQGNPFYLEELLNYVRDRGLDPDDIENIELPESLHALILSRIDQLSEEEKTTLRVASIVGRLFRARWLTGYYPELGSYPQVTVALDALDSLDITPLDSPEPELAYLFKHIVTHEVTYESLTFTMRAGLHEQLANYLERTYSDSPPLEALAFHYGRSKNTTKHIEYLHRAGDAARKNYANDAALDYYEMLLPLLDDSAEITDVYLKRGEVHEWLGSLDEAEDDYLDALKLAQDDASLQARAQFALGKLSRLRGDYDTALEWLTKAKSSSTESKDKAVLAQVYLELGWVDLGKGKYDEARKPFSAGLAFARQIDDRLLSALALNNLGNAAWSQGEYAEARSLYEESLSLRQIISDKAGIAGSLNNLGNVVSDLGDFAEARLLFEESLSLQRSMGNKLGVATSLNNLGVLTHDQGDYETSTSFHEESLSLQRMMGNQAGIPGSLNNLGVIKLKQGDYLSSQVLIEESLDLRRKIGDKAGVASSHSILGDLALAQRDHAAAQNLYEVSLDLMREVGNQLGIVRTLNSMGYLALTEGDISRARKLLEESLPLCEEMKVKIHEAEAHYGIGLADLAESKPNASVRILRGLRLRKELGMPFYLTSNLVGIAALALYEGDATGAAHWLGAIDSSLQSLNVVIHVHVRYLYEQALEATKELLRETAFMSAWSEGVKWSLEEAVARALNEGKQ